MESGIRELRSVTCLDLDGHGLLSNRERCCSLRLGVLVKRTSFHADFTFELSATPVAALNVERQGRRPWRSSEGEEKCFS